MFGLTSSTATDFKPHYFQPRIVQYRQRPMPKIVIAREAYAKMWLYVDIASEEVGWMGTAEKTADGNFFISKVWLLKQQVTSVETEMSTEGLSELATELLSRGDEGMQDWDNLRFWGHSHVRMGTSPSGTDERTMRMLEEAQHPWFIRGILNKLGRIEFTAVPLRGKPRRRRTRAGQSSRSRPALRPRRTSKSRRQNPKRPRLRVSLQVKPMAPPVMLRRSRPKKAAL